MAHQQTFPIEKMCRLFCVSRSGYYAWCRQQQGPRLAKRKDLEVAIQQAYKKSKGTYGSPRVAMELREQGYQTSRATIGRLMCKIGLRSKTRKKFVATTQSKHLFPVAENLLNRDFRVSRLAEVWVSDITYVRVNRKWTYLTAILDLADRRVIGWTLSTELDAQSTILKAWEKAVHCRTVQGPLTFHSDRGVQYACTTFRQVLERTKNVRQSMSRKGDCWDNAVAESFFKTLKTEWIYHHQYKTFEEAEMSIFEYIEGWYNTRRKHSSLEYRSPAEMEQYLLTTMANLT